MTALIQSNIAVKPSDIHGFGVFAQDNIGKGSVIEECYCLLMSEKALLDYTFALELPNDISALPLGFGAIYNHASEPNAIYDFTYSPDIMKITAVKDIKCGEEIFISYGEEYFESRKLETFLHPVEKFQYRGLLRAGLVIIAFILALQLFL